MEIITGKRNRPWLSILYGPPGEGKTTLAATCPGALFLDLERGTDFLDVARVEPEGSIEDSLRSIWKLKDAFSTLVVDSYTAFEKHTVADFCAVEKITTINPADTKDFGKTAKRWREYHQTVIGNLRQFNSIGKNILIIAHTKGRYQNDIASQTEFERLEFDCDKEVAPVLMSMIDGCFLLRKKAIISDGKAIGNGARILHTADKPHYLAKSRWNLPDTIENPNAEFWSKLNV